MKNKIILSLILFLPFISSFAQIVEWEKSFPYEGATHGFQVVQTADGGYIFLGAVDLPTGAIRHHIRLIKTDALGNEEWSQVYNEGSIMLEEGHDVLQTTDGGYIIFGNSTAQNTANNNQQFYILKVDANGIKEWETFSGNPSNGDIGYTIKELSDGSFVACGFTQNNTDGTSQGALLQINNEGFVTDIEWISASNFVKIYDMTLTEVGDVVLVGGNGNLLFLQKRNLEGTVLWEQSLIFSKADIGFCIDQSMDGGFIIGGEGSGFAGTNSTLMKTDAEGMVEWQSFGQSLLSATTDVQSTTDGGFVAIGSTLDFFFGPSAYGFFIKVNESGILEWTYEFPDDTYTGASVKQTNDNGFIMGGSNQSGMYLLKLQGDTPDAVNENKVDPLVKIYPNPTTDFFTIDFDPEIGPTRIQLYNSIGQQVFLKENIKNGASIIVNHLPKGVYWYVLKTSNRQIIQSGGLSIH